GIVRTAQHQLWSVGRGQAVQDIDLGERPVRIEGQRRQVIHPSHLTPVPRRAGRIAPATPERPATESQHRRQQDPSAHNPQCLELEHGVLRPGTTHFPENEGLGATPERRSPGTSLPRSEPARTCYDGWLAPTPRPGRQAPPDATTYG